MDPRQEACAWQARIDGSVAGGKKKEGVCVGRRHALGTGRPTCIHTSVHPPQSWRGLLEMARILAILICGFLKWPLLFRTPIFVLIMSNL
jgi:hypothetical protein